MIKYFTLEASTDNLPLAVATIAPKGYCRGVVQLTHGMTEHKERYEPFMEYLASKGYRCVIHDHRGHGLSVKTTDDLGYMYNGGWKALVEDVKVVNNWIRQQFPGMKCILMGHSMGSLAVRSFAKRYDSHIDGLIVCGSPSFNAASLTGMALAKVMGWVKGEKHRSKLLNFLSFGSFCKQFPHEGFFNAWLCSNHDVLRDYNSDPLCKYVFTCNGFYNLFAMMRDCYNTNGWALKNRHMPVHFISGANDACRISDNDFLKSVNAMKKVGYETTSHLFPNMRHEILNETHKLLVWEHVSKTIDNFLSNKE